MSMPQLDRLAPSRIFTRRALLGKALGLANGFSKVNYSGLVGWPYATYLN